MKHIETCLRFRSEIAKTVTTGGVSATDMCSLRSLSCLAVRGRDNVAEVASWSVLGTPRIEVKRIQKLA